MCTMSKGSSTTLTSKNISDCVQGLPSQYTYGAQELGRGDRRFDVNGGPIPLGLSTRSCW
jgi:hypothetical protein